MPKGTAQRPATAPQARREEDILDDLLQKMAVCNADLRKADHITATRKQDFMESTAYTKSENTFDAMTTYYLGDQRHYANSQLRGDATFFDSTAQRMPPPKQPHAAHSLLQMLPKETRRPRKEDADSMPFELTNVYLVDKSFKRLCLDIEEDRLANKKMQRDRVSRPSTARPSRGL